MYNWIRKAINCLKVHKAQLNPSKSQNQTNILEKYVISAPHPQNALDIFKGEWASKLPEKLADLDAGSIPLFEDSRIIWFVEQIGGIQGKTVLELGPLEAGHTYMLEHYGAKSVTSIEANPRAYLKCLIIKELLELKYAHFLCGDFIKYLQKTEERFDVCIASGVLYHTINPVELIALLAKVTDQLYIWTHYYDKELLSKKVHLARQFSEGELAEYAGFRHTLYRRVYPKEFLKWESFHGGGTASTCWLRRKDIIKCLKYFGLTEIKIDFNDPNHQYGPNIALKACRQ